jgi:hypothetical protein
MERPTSQHAVQCYLTKYLERGAEIDVGGLLIGAGDGRIVSH